MIICAYVLAFLGGGALIVFAFVLAFLRGGVFALCPETPCSDNLITFALVAQCILLSIPVSVDASRSNEANSQG